MLILTSSGEISQHGAFQHWLIGNGSASANVNRLQPVDSKAGTDFGNVGSGRFTAGQQGRARPGRTGRRRDAWRDADGSPRGPLSLVACKASRSLVAVDMSEVRKCEFLGTAIEERNPLRPAIAKLFFRRTESAFLSWLLTSDPYWCKACPAKMPSQGWQMYSGLPHLQVSIGASHEGP